MLELLEVIKPISGHREFVFPSDRDQKNHVIAKQKIWHLNEWDLLGD